MFNFSIIREVITNFRNLWTSEPSTDLSRVRKRRAHESTHHLMEHSDIGWSPKRRHLLDHRGVIVLDGDNISPRAPLGTVRSPINQNYPNETIELDDDEIVPVKRGNETRFKVRSKQAEKKGVLTQQNGSAEKYPEDDVVLVSFTKPSNTSPWLTKNGFQSNGTRRSDPRSQACGIKQPTLNYSVRLDDMKQYKRLLETSSGSENSFYTPTGKLLEYDTANMTRTERILNKARSPPFRSPGSSGLSTRDTIKKVLNKFDNDLIVIKDSEDSDSDVVFVNPPSPKPDIQVEPVNSLKKVVDQSMETSPDWIENLMKTHKDAIESRQRGIDKLKEVSEVHHKINNEMHIDLLTKRVNNALRLKEVILPIKEKEEELPDLTAAQLKMVQKAFKGHPDDVLVSKFNLNITRRDITTLDGLNWLNDEVINFYMNLIIERGKNKKWPKAYAFNTFFYLKLSKEGPESLRRWTKRVDLFQYDLICVPIHLGMHWCMAIIDLRNKTIKYYDSMNSNNNRCLNQLRNYLEVEHLDKKKTSFDTSSFKLENVKDIPQQMNGSDCGMFSCTFAEFITRDAAITFTQEHMPYLRRKMVVELLTGEMLIK